MQENDKTARPPESPEGGLEDNINGSVNKNHNYLSTVSLKPPARGWGAFPGESLLNKSLQKQACRVTEIYFSGFSAFSRSSLTCLFFA